MALVLWYADGILAVKSSILELVDDYLDAVRKGRATARKSKLGFLPKSATVSQYRVVLVDVFLPLSLIHI